MPPVQTPAPHAALSGSSVSRFVPRPPLLDGDVEHLQARWDAMRNPEQVRFMRGMVDRLSRNPVLHSPMLEKLLLSALSPDYCKSVQHLAAEALAHHYIGTGQWEDATRLFVHDFRLVRMISTDVLIDRMTQGPCVPPGIEVALGTMEATHNPHIRSRASYIRRRFRIPPSASAP